MKNFCRVGLIGLIVSAASLSFAALKSDAKRSTQVIDDHSVKVSIQVLPEATAKAYAIEERAPKGCTVSKVDNKGTLEKTHNLIKWGVFFDSNSRTLSYEVSCPEKDFAKLTFKGQASFDGKSIQITDEKAAQK